MIHRLIQFTVETDRKSRQFFWAVFIALILPVLCISLYSCLRTYHDLTRIAIERRQALAHLAATTLQEKLERWQDLGISLATRVRFRELTRPCASTIREWG